MVLLCNTMISEEKNKFYSAVKLKLNKLHVDCLHALLIFFCVLCILHLNIIKCFQKPVKERMHYKFEVQFEQSQTKSEQ